MTREHLNQLLGSTIIRNNTLPSKTYHILEGVTYVWKQDDQQDFVAILAYPDILFEGPRQYLRQWAESLLQKCCIAYSKYYAAATAASCLEQTTSRRMIRVDPEPFDKVFYYLLTESKTKTTEGTTTTTATTTIHESQTSKPAVSSASTSSKKGKENRHWGGTDAKVTEKDMAKLDMSKKDTDETATKTSQERALAEARLAFLPTEDDLQQALDDKDVKVQPDTWSSTVTGLFQQLTGNKVLQDSDLDAPLKTMEELLTSKNVAREVAANLCETVKVSLRGKRLNSMYRVQTAVQQALESSIQRILQNNVDLLRNVLAKRGDGSFFSSSKKKAPYVISVMGINGIGKTTSLAKLAYYFQINGCKPLLVAGDTFRSGAVEQLQVHADCLQIPLFSQGYSKDPSSVAKAAIQQATEQGNDVVLIDTAGRMQNNVPLMKALGKLVQENKPDFVIQVCEALVGHDGLSQFHMFQQAMGSRGVDGLILTKYDTVSDKVGAALTLSFETGTPIVFTGTGQKYHHLKKMSVPSIVNSLFS